MVGKREGGEEKGEGGRERKGGRERTEHKNE